MDVDEKPTIVKKGRGVNLIYRGHCHKKDRVSAGKQLWRCVKAKGCTGRAHTIGDGENLDVVHFVDKSHPPDEEKAFAAAAKSTLCDLVHGNPQPKAYNRYTRILPPVRL